jgi:hypothetical protein
VSALKRRMQRLEGKVGERLEYAIYLSPEMNGDEALQILGLAPDSSDLVIFIGSFIADREPTLCWVRQGGRLLDKSQFLRHP